MNKRVIICALTFLSILSAYADPLLSPEDGVYSVSVETEAGVVKVLTHTYQNGDDGTEFNYVTQGGQDILFPVQRWNVEMKLKERHSFALLYQPLEVTTRISFDDDVVIDGITFAADTPMEVKYGFPFWRFTYLYDLLPQRGREFSVGGSLQLRNASLLFQALTDQSGPDLVSSQNLGPVPALAVRGRFDLPGGFYLAGEATGLYASSAVINGASFEFEGSILDASLQGGVKLNRGIEGYLKTRFLGGTAVGNSEYVDRTWSESESSYTSNKLTSLFITLGLRLN